MTKLQTFEKRYTPCSELGQSLQKAQLLVAPPQTVSTEFEVEN